MKKINKGIVFSNDILRILKGKNALNFNYEERGMKIPNEDDIKFLRDNFRKDVNRIFNNEVEIISEKEMEMYSHEILEDKIDIPIVSLDKIYLDENTNIDNDVYFLDCTRINNSKELVPRKGKDAISVIQQIRRISDTLKAKGKRNILLFDDVVFSGTVLRKIASQFEQNGIRVQGINACISTEESFEYFNEQLEEGLKCGCLLGKDVIDQVCERDFYFGIVQSGISVADSTGEMYKAPYFRPFGNSIERASVPKKYEAFFSNGCLLRSLYLWKKIEENTGKSIYIKDLPEKIINTNENDRILDVLRKGLIYDDVDKSICVNALSEKKIKADEFDRI